MKTSISTIHQPTNNKSIETVQMLTCIFLVHTLSKIESQDSIQ